MTSESPPTISEDEGGGGSLRLEPALVLRWSYPDPPPKPLALAQRRVRIGRDREADVRLPSARVSRLHAEIVPSGPLHVIVDLDSKNGVFVNGRRVVRAALTPGDVVRIGNFLGVLVEAPVDADLGFGALAAGLFGGHRHRALIEQTRSLSASTLPLVLEGATGTGKEILARAIHGWSGRAGPFLPVNCAVYSPSLAAAELFGFRKGAFTGAEHASPGHVRSAQGGTLLLDELVDLPLEVQAMLLRVLESNAVLPLGDNRPLAVDVRFIAASQAPLAAAVTGGKFRADLRARLEGAVLRLPPLSECREIVVELFSELYRRHSQGAAPEFDVAVAEQLSLHDWPLNIRELDMLARRLAAARAEPRAIELAELELPLREDEPAPGRRSSPAYEQEEIDGLLAALARHDGNVSRAVLELGISRGKAYRILQILEERKPGGRRGS